MHKLVRILLLLGALTAVGSAWFWLIEGWTLVDSIYMTVITISTVGFSEVNPLTDRARIFVMFFLVVGLGIFMYGVIELGELVIRAELRQWWRRQSMDQELRSLKDHFIICGFGRMGQMVCRQLAEQGVPFVTIDRDEEAMELCQQNRWPWILGDATEDRVLAEAGIDRARGLATVLSTDADNLYVVLSARLLRSDLRLIARAYDDLGAEKMQRAGANQVISLYTSGATKMAHLLTNPNLGDFFEFVAEGGMTFDLAEISVTPEDPFAHKSLAESDFRDRGVIIVGIRRNDGTVVLPPSSTTVIEPGNDLFAIGNAAAIAELTREGTRNG
jgi:voltage-gated potassium channel